MAGPPPRRLLEGLDRAVDCIEANQWDEALEILEALDRRYPDQPDVLGMMLEAFYEIKEMHSYQTVCERLVKIDFNDPDLLLSLAGAYMINLYPMHAQITFEDYQINNTQKNYN